MKPPSPTTVHPRVQIPATARSQAESEQLPAGTLTKVRADFRKELFFKEIQQKGLFYVWRKALICTCYDPATDQARPNCRVCDASGFFYVEPILIQAVTSGLSHKKDVLKNIGTWLEGSAMVTVHPAHRLGYRDSLEMRHSVMTFNEVLKKGNRHGIRSDVPAGYDVARYRIVRALHVMYEVDERPVSIEQGVHYEISDKGWIKWLGPGAKIPDGTVFSINYEFHPVWLVVNHPYGVRDTVTKFKKPDFTVEALPLRAMMQLDYLTPGQVTNTSDVLMDRGSVKEEA